MNNYPIIPRSAEIIKRQLADLDSVIESADRKCNDLSSNIFLDSIDSHKQELLEELKASEWLETHVDIEFILDGFSVKDHAVSASLLSKIIDYIQKLRYATAENTRGNMFRRGRFTKDLFNESELLIRAFTSSSFAIQIKYAKDYLSNNLLCDNVERPGETLFLSLLSGDDDSEDLEFISMTPRLRNYYFDFLNLISNDDIIISTRTKNHPFSVKITSENARKIKQLIDYNLSTAKQKEDEILIEGILMMGNLKTQTFMIQTGSTFYKGKISENGILGLKHIPLGSNVTAKLLSYYSSEESDKVSFLLLSINRLSV
jgi:hypothetical protein